MSLINDMLRDLERRQAPDRSEQVQAQGYGALTRKEAPASTRAIPVLLGVIIIALLASVASWWYLQTAGSTESGESTGVAQRLEAPVHVSTAEPSIQGEIIRPPGSTATPPEQDMGVTPVTSSASLRSPENQEPAVRQETVTEQPEAPVDVSEGGEHENVLGEVVTEREESPDLSRQPEGAEPVAAAIAKIEDMKKAPQVARSASVALHQRSADRTPHTTVSFDSTVATKSPATNVAESSVAELDTVETPKRWYKVPVLTPEQRDEEAAEAAEGMFQSGHVEKARAYLSTFINEHPVNDRSRAVLVADLMQYDRMQEAGDLLTAANIERSSHLRRLKAHWLSVNGQPTEAIAILNSALPDIESDAEYYVLLAALYQQEGYSAEAVAAYAELLRYNANRPDWWVGMAISLDRSGRYPAAIRAYQHALQMKGLRVELADFAKQRLVILDG